MPKTITQKVLFKNAAAKNLYDLYMNAKKHSEVTGSAAKISDREGTKFSAYNLFITGKNLQLIKDKLIVQSWRGSDWNIKDVDSTFIILFEEKGKDVVLHVVHADLPDDEAKGIDDGWHTYYWDLWKQYLEANKSLKYKAM